MKEQKIRELIQEKMDKVVLSCNHDAKKIVCSECRKGNHKLYQEYNLFYGLLRLREFVDKVLELKHIPNSCIPKDRLLMDKKEMINLTKEAKDLQEKLSDNLATT